MPELDPQELLRHIPPTPGVYQMLGADGEMLYVGKAKDLAKRVASYFRRTSLPATCGKGRVGLEGQVCW